MGLKEAEVFGRVGDSTIRGLDSYRCSDRHYACILLFTIPVLRQRIVVSVEAFLSSYHRESAAECI